MRGNYKIFYHSFYWIYKGTDIMIYNHYLWDTDWYWGGFCVQLIVAPFFYIHYGVLLPMIFIKKRKIQYSLLIVIWALSFIFILSRWNMYHNHLLYDSHRILDPSYISSINNLIALYFISSAFFFIDFYIGNRKKNLELYKAKQSFELKKQKFDILPGFVASVIKSIKRQAIDQIPDTIVLLSDLIKYILYTNDKSVPLSKEIEHVKIYQRLKNLEQKNIIFSEQGLNNEVYIHPVQLIYLIEDICSLNQAGTSISLVVTSTPNLVSLHVSKEYFSANNYFNELFKSYSLTEENGNIIFNLKCI